VYSDPTRSKVWQQLSARPFRVFEHILTRSLIARAADAAGCALGAGPLNLYTLVWLALGSAFFRTRPFVDVLCRTLKLLADLSEGPQPLDPSQPPKRSKERCHDPRVDDPSQLSEEAFGQARRRLPWAFWLALIGLLADDFAKTHHHGLLWQNRFRLFCLDGTTIDLPNWSAVAKYFGTASKGKGRRQAQARLVMLQLTNARMPWRFDLTPLKQSEQAVAAGLLDDLRPDDLVLMDRNFFTYSLFWRVQRRGAFFATRLRKQVKLKTLSSLGQGDRLVEWQPASSQAKKAIKEMKLPESITLRVIDYQVAGFRPSAVVTNLLDNQEVPPEEFVKLAATEEGRRLAAGLYHRRWEIEISFLELKVTQGLEGSLRSRTPAGIYFEVGGHVLLYQLMRWLLADAAQQAGLDDPLRLSFQDGLRELEDLQAPLLRSGMAKIRRVWRPRLLERMAQHEVPWRPNRHYKRPHDTKGKSKGGGRVQPASKLEPQPQSASANPQQRE
jgi:hypothetical protein